MLTNESFCMLFCRVDEQSGIVLQHIQYVLLVGFGYMASAVPETILQSEETDRIIKWLSTRKIIGQYL